MKKILYLLPLILLAACNAAEADKAPETFTVASEKGVAVGTLTFEADKPVNDIYRFFYYPQSGDKKFKKQNDGKIQIKARIDNDRAFNGDFNNKKTYLFIIEREPGNYAFTQYNYLDHIGYAGMVTASREFAIPFEIKKGEIAYIGEFTYNDLAEPGSPRIVVTDNYERDMAEFRKKHPGISWDAATNRTVKSGETGGGTIDFR